MQEQVWVRRFCSQNPKNTLFFASKEPPLPPGLELLIEDLRSSGLKLVKNTPQNENLIRTATLSFGLPSVPPPPPPMKT